MKKEYHWEWEWNASKRNKWMWRISIFFAVSALPFMGLIIMPSLIHGMWQMIFPLVLLVLSTVWNFQAGLAARKRWLDGEKNV